VTKKRTIPSRDVSLIGVGLRYFMISLLRRDYMENIDRRSAIVLGAAILAPVIASPRSAQAAMYDKDAGKEIMPGIRQVDLSKASVALPTYKTVVITDYIVADLPHPRR
jgi:hypothetical protein